MRSIGWITLCVALTVPAVASAQVPVEEHGLQHGFIEATGNWGLQIGRTPYVPDEAADQFKHPLTNGFGVGGTVGWRMTQGLAVIANYQYARSDSRDGSVQGVLDNIEGRISYQTLVIGLRLYRSAGRGRVFADMAAGLIFPFSTRLKYTYGAALAPAGITGTGRRKDEYGLGPGVRAGFGYAYDFAPNLYVGSYLGFEAFESNNNGEKTIFENFVEDFTAMPPTATNATVEYDNDGGPQPDTYGVAAARLFLTLGLRF
jgi:hypothetical protein